MVYSSQMFISFMSTLARAVVVVFVQSVGVVHLLDA
jgi:hypothetical protein